MAEARLQVLKSTYPADVLLSAAYPFLGTAYIHFEEEGDRWTVCIRSKSEEDPPEHIARRLENELIAQTVRKNVYLRTHTVRDLLMARAMTTSMIDREDPLKRIAEDGDSDISEEELASILTEWFEKHETP